MTGRTLRIVLLVSLSHAMVHTFELVYPAIEQEVQSAFGLTVRTSGIIANVWAFPFGFGALAAGWIADRIGSRRVLIVYLLGCSASCVAVGFATGLPTLLVAMFMMGSFASLYHPAGLAYISRIVPRKSLGSALGYHGIVGSIGIAGAPLLVGSLLLVTDWQGVYLTLALPGILLATLFWLRLPDDETHSERGTSADDAGDWTRFATLCVVTMLFGMIYRGFVTFLPRYLGETSLSWFAGIGESQLRYYLTSAVLTCGILGQYAGGWLCGRVRVEALLVGCVAMNVPFLYWLGAADGVERLVATAGFAVIHFMMQPVGNTLIARYTPSRSRSLGYGISFFVSFGFGSFGASYAGAVAEQHGVSAIYPRLAVLAVLAVLGSLVVLWRSDRADEPA